MSRDFTNKERKVIKIILGICFLFLVFVLYWFRNPFVKEYTIEAGQSIKITDLMKEDKARDPKFITEMNESILNKVGTHKIKVAANDGDFEIDLIVKDTIAPEITVQSYHYFIGDEFDVNKFIKEVKDFTTVSAKMDDDVDLTKNGDFEVNVTFSDEGNNIVSKKAKLKVEKDDTAPVIDAPKSISIKKGDTILYKKLIKVTDNRDGEITNFEIDNSQVNLTRVGNYSITVTAIDKNKNKSQINIPIHIELKDKSEAKEEARKYAQDILATITKSSMSKEEKLKAIYDYVKNTYKYVGIHEGGLEDYYVDALNGFMTKQGDCYVVNAMARTLLEEVGIETVGLLVEDGKYKNDHITFMANAGNGWYHYCCLRKVDKVDIYRWTDAQYIEYGTRAYHLPAIDLSAYPDTPLV